MLNFRVSARAFFIVLLALSCRLSFAIPLWVNLPTPNTTFNPGTMLLLTDGSIMCQNGGSADWWKLTPDSSGNYITGSWTQLASMHDPRLYYASEVLKDGRVLVAGGEYSTLSETYTGEIYNPVTNTWTYIASIQTALGWNHLGDAPCETLPDGRILFGSNWYDQTQGRTAIYDPVHDTWSQGPDKFNLDNSSEESWTLLPDQSILTINCVSEPNVSHRYISTNLWGSAGITPVPIVNQNLFEIGPSILLPNGSDFLVGGVGNTAIYTPPLVPTDIGTWQAGPTFPIDPDTGTQLQAPDAPACLLPDGTVLCSVGPYTLDNTGNETYPNTSLLYLYDPATSALTQVTTPPNADYVTFAGRMMLLPNGQVLYGNAGSIYVYTGSGGPNPRWRPSISNVVAHGGGNYTLAGIQLNGLSEALGYGDDVASATNYPIVRVKNMTTGHIYYGRTFNRSSTGVATGSALLTTDFSIPAAAGAGPLELYAVANGIASIPWTLNWPGAAFGGTISQISNNPVGVSTIEAENYDTGGEGISYHDLVNGGQTDYRSDNVGVISDANASNGHAVGFVAPGEWYGYTITAAPADSYNISLMTGAGGGGACHLEFGPVGVTSGPEVTASPSFAVPASAGGSYNPVTVNCTIPEGTQWMRLVIDSGSFTIDTIVFAPQGIDAFSYIEAESADGQSGTSFFGTYVGNFDTGDWLRYSTVDFGGGGGANSIIINLATTAASGLIEVHLDSPTGPLIGVLPVSSTGDYNTFVEETVGIQNTTGVHDVYLVGAGGVSNIGNLDYLRFSTQTVPVATPTFTPGGGSFTAAQSVSISTTTPGATIYYTTDGSAPSSATSAVYSGPITISSSTTLNAIAVESGLPDSDVATAAYTIAAAVATPTFNPNGGAFTTAQSVSISCATSGATIRYTTDGSTPTSTTGTVYSGPITISSTTTLKAIASLSGFPDSGIAIAAYTLTTQAAAPSFTPGAGTYTAPQTVAISSATASAAIRYTTDGSAPTSTSGTIYTGPITISSTATLKAIAYQSGMSDSPVTSAVYTINPPTGQGGGAPAPVIASYSGGMQMISLPYDYSGISLDQIFGYANVKLATWVTDQAQYAVTPTAPADKIQLGRGYWVRLPQAVSISQTGAPANPNQDFAITLPGGWNEIGDPFPYAVQVSNLQVRKSDGTVLSWGDAVTANQVKSIVYSYNSAGNVYTAANSLQAGQGYWVHAVSPVTLLVPHTR